MSDENLAYLIFGCFLGVFIDETYRHFSNRNKTTSLEELQNQDDDSQKENSEKTSKRYIKTIQVKNNELEEGWITYHSVNEFGLDYSYDSDDDTLCIYQDLAGDDYEELACLIGYSVTQIVNVLLVEIL